jgi:MFS family permease
MYGSMSSPKSPKSPKSDSGSFVDVAEQRRRSNQLNQRVTAVTGQEAPSKMQGLTAAAAALTLRKPARRREIRVLQVYLVAVSRMMCYLARAQLGALLPYLSHELMLSSVDKGYMMSRYASGYLLTQIPGGILADKAGGYAVVASVILATALCCIAAPLLASPGNAAAFGIPFFLMGLSQGVVMPAGNVLMAKWILPSERSWASGITGMGACLGTLVINLAAGPIATRWGWRVVFYFTALGCSIFLGSWLMLAASSPEFSPDLSPEESLLLQQAGLAPSKTTELKESTETKQQQEEAGGSTKQRPLFNPHLFMHMATWTPIFCNFVQNSQIYFAEWLPFFFTTQLGVNPGMVSVYLTVISFVEMPARTMTLDMPEKLQQRGFSLLQCRRTMSVQGFSYHLVLLGVVLVLFRSGVRWPLAYTILFMLSKAVQSFHAGGYFANYLDLTRNYAGMLTGVGNTVASCAGVVVPQFIAECLQEDEANWLPVFGGLILANVLAIALLVFCMSTSCLDDVMHKVSKCNHEGG